MSTFVVVVKVGGSLFLQRDFISRLKHKIAKLSDELAPAHLVLITGGGPLVDALRSMDRVNRIPEEFAHRAAIHLMDINARLLQCWWPELQCADSMPALQARLSKPGATLFCVEAYLLNREPTEIGTTLAVGWDVTSDSIAARIAEILAAVKLVLLKSNPGPSGENLHDLAADGVVDAAFPRFAGGLRNISLEILSQVT